MENINYRGLTGRFNRETIVIHSVKLGEDFIPPEGHVAIFTNLEVKELSPEDQEEIYREIPELRADGIVIVHDTIDSVGLSSLSGEETVEIYIMRKIYDVV
ncbi:hypothetical protein [Brevibacillus laterosporus]|uniref:hypothetical protein n=1 Tax=Brevibacillus laterosporus TaxID=1465 RepID=UPI003D1EAEAD